MSRVIRGPMVWINRRVGSLQLGRGEYNGINEITIKNVLRRRKDKGRHDRLQERNGQKKMKNEKRNGNTVGREARGKWKAGT